MPRIYLAGPIHRCTDSEVINWRHHAIKRLAPMECIDPTLWDFRGTERENAKTIVETDKIAIMGADIVLANCWRREMVGTIMEILFAWEQRKPVYVAAGSHDFGPWMEYHANICATLDDAIDAIRRDYRKE